MIPNLVRLADMSDDSIYISRPDSTSMTSDESDTHRYESQPVEDRSRRYRMCCFYHSLTAPTRTQVFGESSTTPLTPVDGRYQSVYNYLPYRVDHKPHGYNDDVASEILNIRKKVMVEKKDQAYSGKDPISVINFQGELVRSSGSTHFHGRAVVWVFREFLNDIGIALSRCGSPCQQTTQPGKRAQPRPMPRW